MSRIVFLDLETTGLDPKIHEPWEFGLIVRTENPDHERGDASKRWVDTPYLWRRNPNLSLADPVALKISRFGDAIANMDDLVVGDCNILNPRGRRSWSKAERIAPRIARLLDGAVVVGCNPGFDERFLRPFLELHGDTYRAHYRPICVTTAGYGWLLARGRADTLTWPLSSSEVSRALGVDPNLYARHTAIGDCQWAAAQWDAMHRTAP